MNQIKEKFLSLNSALNSELERIRIQENDKDSILQSLKESIKNNLQQELLNIQEECEILGHSIEIIEKTDNLVLSDNRKKIKICNNCGKTWNDI